MRLSSEGGVGEGLDVRVGGRRRGGEANLCGHASVEPDHAVAVHRIRVDRKVREVAEPLPPVCAAVGGRVAVGAGPGAEVDRRALPVERRPLHPDE